MMKAQLEAEARRRWDAREAIFPAFTRMAWERGTWLARMTLLAEVAKELTGQGSDGSLPANHIHPAEPGPPSRGPTRGPVA